MIYELRILIILLNHMELKELLSKYNNTYNVKSKKDIETKPYSQ